MPTPAKKRPIHLARHIGELNTMASEIPKVTNARVFCRTADQLFKKGETSVFSGDEETAYVMYMRYFNVITAIKKTSEYKKNEKFFKEMIGTKNSIRAIDQAEKLSTSLKDRYDEREAEEVSKKLETLNLEREKISSETEGGKEKSDSEKKDGETEKESSQEGGGEKNDKKMKETIPNGLQPATPGFIDVHEMYSILTGSVDTILFMDVRPEDQFDNSHINHRNCINVPSDIIPPGTTVTYIVKALPEASRALWEERANMDHIILLDWRCDLSSLTPGTTLASLKDALFKWDPYARLKAEPRVLTGGYEEWLTYYPMLTTNANVLCPPGYTKAKPQTASLDTIAYDLDLAFLSSPEKEEEEVTKSKLDLLKEELASSEGDVVSQPKVDRSLKPKIGGDLNNVNNRNQEGQAGNYPSDKSINLNIKNDIYQEGNIKDNLSKVSVSEAIIKNSENITEVTNKLHSTVVKEMKVPSSIPPIASPKVVNVPSVNRTLKPKVDMTEAAPAIVSPSVAEVELQEALQLRQLKQESYEQFRAENRGLVEERRARIAALKAEEHKLEALGALKKKELAETAQLMRQKRRIEAELSALQIEKAQAEAEEKTRKEEVERLKEEEMKKRQCKEEADHLRAIRKQESAKKMTEGRREESPVHAEKITPIQQEDLSEQDEWVHQENTAEELSKAAREQEDRAKRDAFRREQAEKDKREKEALRLEQEQAERKKREKQEKVRLAHEEQVEREREAERKRLQKEKVEKEKIERENRRLENKLADDTGGATAALPVGWQKILDPITGVYKYIDHTAKPKLVQMYPPEMPGSPRRPATATPTVYTPGVATPPGASTPEHHGGVYKTRLRDESDTPRSGGLRRSHSSPNIAQMVTDEDTPEPLRPYLPSVERGNKPRSPRPEMIPAKSEVSAAKVRNLQPTWGNVGRGLTGLRNLGNTCYMNSTIQCLSNTTFLTTYFLRDNYRMDINRENVLGKKGEVAEEFAVLVKALWTGQYRSVTPRDFKLTMAKHHHTFAGYDQQDAQEMLLFLLDSLHEDLNKVRKRPKIPDQENDGLPDNLAADKAWSVHKKLNDSVVIDLFQGQFMSTLMCIKCEKKSVTFDSFMYLTVPIPSNSRCTLRDCLLHFAKEEQMVGDSQWHCPRCKCRRDAIKRIVIWRLPRILLIHLKRFYYQGMWRQKINAQVDFPLDGLDLNKSIQGSQKRPPYHLYAVSNHYGTMEGGHYTAYCKSPSNSRWYKFDDHEVYEISRSDIKSPAAYILYYTSIHQDMQFAT